MLQLDANVACTMQRHLHAQQNFKAADACTFRRAGTEPDSVIYCPASTLEVHTQASCLSTPVVVRTGAEVCRGSEAVDPPYRGSESAMGEAWWMKRLAAWAVPPGTDEVRMAGCAWPKLGAGGSWEWYDPECCGSSSSVCMPKPGKPPEPAAAGTSVSAGRADRQRVSASQLKRCMAGAHGLHLLEDQRALHCNCAIGCRGDHENWYAWMDSPCTSATVAGAQRLSNMLIMEDQRLGSGARQHTRAAGVGGGGRHWGSDLHRPHDCTAGIAHLPTIARQLPDRKLLHALQWSSIKLIICRVQTLYF